MDQAVHAKKTILIFSTAYLPLIGGAEIAVQEVTRRIPEYRWILYCARIKPGLATHEHVENVEVHRIGVGVAALDKVLLPLLAPLIAFRHRNVHAIWAIMASYGGLAARIVAAFRPQVPFVLSVQEGDSEEHIRRASRGFFWMVQAIFRRASVIHAISSSLGAWAVKMGYAGNRVEVIPNGVAVAHFAEPTETRSEVRAALGIPSDAWVVVTVSRLVEKNGVGDLIAACAALPLDTHLIIVGSGGLEPVLRQRAQSIRERVHFVGSIGHRDLPTYLHASDVFCRASISEGLGNVFLEAQAAGIPVVATPVGGIPDIVESDVTGVFCEPNNPQSIVQAITRLRGDNELRERCRGEGLRRAKNFDWSVIAQKIQNLFRQL